MGPDRPKGKKPPMPDGLPSVAMLTTCESASIPVACAHLSRTCVERQQGAVGIMTRSASGRSTSAVEAQRQHCATPRGTRACASAVFHGYPVSEPAHVMRD